MAQGNGAWWKKLGWLIGLWSASVVALAIVAWLLRLVMQAVGLTL